VRQLKVESLFYVVSAGGKCQLSNINATINPLETLAMLRASKLEVACRHIISFHYELRQVHWFHLAVKHAESTISKAIFPCTFSNGNETYILHIAFFSGSVFC
jgi:hypothetical protein